MEDSDKELWVVATDMDPAETVATGALTPVEWAARSALRPVAPDATFRARLHQDLLAAARRAEPSRASRLSAAVRRRRLRGLVRGGAAVAVIGIAAAVLLRERAGEQVAAGS